ncbi:MAG: SpoIIE family protein phosphatase [Anaerolineae bacterium]|nr:SpoIIE family protein phosphatase [Anaerolineae bacterium]MCB0178637.1 SpoIIE family protein phosphatase [Anaerolineae bacterium]MCB0223328.1 SpoIIE family protein phosphatase [Anaerolineae bacterium]MCB9102927.1 SpoIIE family protein phosphatase [Anaerolineales bacterium]
MDDEIRAALELALGILPDDDLNVLIQAVNKSEYEAGSIVCREGELEPVFYIIQDGKVAFTKKMDKGEQFLGLKGRGEFFGELGVLDRAPRAATVHAISDCKLLEIHETTLDMILTRNPSVARAIMRGITRSVRDTDQITIAELQLKNDELGRTLDNLRAAQAELVRRERMKRDLEIAAIVHQSILPTSFPEIPNFEFAAIARPAREIGGDLYDVIPIDDKNVGIVMADASGKSVQAAIYMAVVRALFLSQAHAHLSTTEIAHQVHELLLKVSTAEMFVTAFYANLNYTTRSMTYIRGGHDRPVLYRAATQEIELLDAPGRFLGLLPNLIVQEESLSFEKGDILVCYSDGVTDATRPDDQEMYGLERLQTIVTREGHRPAKELANIIVTDIDEFRDGEEQPDDLTLLITKAV